MTEPAPGWRSRSVLGAVAAIAIVLIADLTLQNPKGGSSDLVLFLGRFHPLVVHLPIGILLLVAAAELASFVPRLRERVDPVLGLVLPLLVLSAISAFLLGHLLAREGGFPARALLWHRRLVLLALLGACGCLAAWALRDRRHGRSAYRGLLGISLALLSVGAHFGGTLSRGDSYLAKYAPGPLKPFLGGDAAPSVSASVPAEPAPSREPLLFADVVQPILKKYCVECHGPDKAKGDLRLDTLEYIKKGGENGAVLLLGSAEKSPLIRRMLLPVGDDDRMPPEDKPAPNAAQIAAIRFWIDRDADTALEVRDALPPESLRALLEKTLISMRQVPDAPPAREPEALAPVAPPPAAAETAGSKTAAERQAAAPRPSEESKPPAPPGSSEILAQKCAPCHGENKQKGKLRVDSRAALLQGGRGGPAIVPGHPEQSELLRRVRLPLDDSDHMPPEGQQQLDAREVRVLSAWIRGMTASEQLAAAPASTAAPPAQGGTSEPVAAAAHETTDTLEASAEVTLPRNAKGVSGPATHDGGVALASQRVAAERAPARNSQPGEVRERPSGCGACGVGAARSTPLAAFAAFAAVLAFALRRR